MQNISTFEGSALSFSPFIILQYCAPLNIGPPILNELVVHNSLNTVPATPGVDFFSNATSSLNSLLVKLEEPNK